MPHVLTSVFESWPGTASEPDGHFQSPNAALNHFNDLAINNSQGTSKLLSTATKNDLRRGQHQVFNFGNEAPLSGLVIPAGATVVEAFMRFTSQGVIFNPDQTTPLETVASLVARDGLWDPIVANPDGNLFGPGAFDADAQVDFLNLSGLLSMTGITWVGTSEVFLDTFSNPAPNASPSRLAQTVLATTSDTLGFVKITLKRTGSPSLNTMRIQVYQARANDGSDDRPDEGLGVLATSDGILFNDVGTGDTGETKTFTFPVGQQIAITSGVRYVAVLDQSDEPGMSVIFRTASGYATGNAQSGGTRLGFANSNYFQSTQLPWLFEDDDSTIDTAPHGSVTPAFAFPAFPTPLGQVHEIRPPNFATLVQEWIDDPLYSASETIAVQVNPTAASAFGARRGYSFIELEVDWIPPLGAAIPEFTCVFDEEPRAFAFVAEDRGVPFSPDEPRDKKFSAESRAVVFDPENQEEF